MSNIRYQTLCGAIFLNWSRLQITPNKHKHLVDQRAGLQTFLASSSRVKMIHAVRGFSIELVCFYNVLHISEQYENMCDNRLFRRRFLGIFKSMNADEK